MSKTTVIVELIRVVAKALKMPGLSRAFEELCRQADKDRCSYEELLHEALSVEVASRNASSVRLRIAEARFPEVKTLDTFDFKLADGVDTKIVATLARGDYIDRAESIVLLGPVGTGKTHLATALGVEAAKLRKRVAFRRAADLVRDLIEARDARELTRMQRRLARADLLIIDELGFVPFDRQGGELLFNLLSSRHLKQSAIITSNLAFSEWPSVFAGDEKMTAALLDRFAETTTVIVTHGKSYRARRRSDAKGKATADVSDAPKGDS